MAVMWNLLKETVGAQIDVAGGALPADSMDFLDPTGVIITRNVLMPHPQSSIINNLHSNHFIFFKSR